MKESIERSSAFDPSDAASGNDSSSLSLKEIHLSLPHESWGKQGFLFKVLPDGTMLLKLLHHGPRHWHLIIRKTEDQGAFRVILLQTTEDADGRQKEHLALAETRWLCSKDLEGWIKWLQENFAPAADILINALARGAMKIQSLAQLHAVAGYRSPTLSKLRANTEKNVGSTSIRLASWK